MKNRLAGLALAATAGLGTLAALEPILRLRYAEPVREPGPDVLAIQQHLVLDPDLGFRWRANVSPEENIVFEVGDIDFVPLATDTRGIINHPDAIANDPVTEVVDVVALGDSFMEMAARTLYERFGQHGLSFRSLAIHRQAPPQYAALLERHGPALQPDLVLVGLFENDFWETGDYENWQQSGLDWFTFHSGTWCGWPVSPNPVARAAQRFAPGYYGLAHVVSTRIRGDRMTITGPSKEEIAAVRHALRDIVAAARELDAEPVVVFIPSRASATGPLTAEAGAYDGLLAAMKEMGVATIDLRPIFREHSKPASLYYEEDAHSNADGMALASDRILALFPTGT